METPGAQERDANVWALQEFTTGLDRDPSSRIIRKTALIIYGGKYIDMMSFDPEN